jgi:hypothetical protein
MDPILQRLDDENEIRKLVFKMSLGMDTLDDDLFAAACAPRIYIDIPHLAGLEMALAGDLDGKEYARNVIDLMRGFTAVQHASTNHIIDVKGDEATCSSYVIGSHYMAEDPEPWLLVGGLYNFQVRRFPDLGWRIVRFRVTQFFNQGNQGVWEIVTRKALARRAEAATA